MQQAGKGGSIVLVGSMSGSVSLSDHQSHVTKLTSPY